MRCGAAAVGCLVGAILIAYGAVWIAVADPPSHAITSALYEQPQQGSRRTEPTRALTPVANQSQSATNTKEYQRPCNDPKTPEEHDLCQQWRMAEASEELVTLAYRQFWATIGEITVLVVTVGCTAWAAYAASRAARAAEAVIQITTAFSQQELRAYIGIQEAQLTIADAYVANANILINNSGQTPAYNVRQRISYKCVDQEATLIPWREDSEWVNVGILDRGHTVTMKMAVPIAEINSCIPVPGQSRDMCIYGSISYVDAFKVDRYRHFRYFVYRSKGGLRSHRAALCSKRTYARAGHRPSGSLSEIDGREVRPKAAHMRDRQRG